MWVFTETGFVSAVARRDDPDHLVVRARDRISLEPLAALDADEIVLGAGSDYPYRIVCHRETFSRWIAGQIESIDYRNFKNRVYDTRGDDFAHALMGVWTAMLEATDDEAAGW